MECATLIQFILLPPQPKRECRPTLSPILSAAIASINKGEGPDVNYDRFALSPIEPNPPVDIFAALDKGRYLSVPDADTPLNDSTSRVAPKSPPQRTLSPIMERFLSEEELPLPLIDPKAKSTERKTQQASESKAGRSRSASSSPNLDRQLDTAGLGISALDIDGLSKVRDLSIRIPRRTCWPRGTSPPPSPIRPRFGVDSRMVRERNGRMSLESIPLKNKPIETNGLRIVLPEGHSLQSTPISASKDPDMYLDSSWRSQSSGATSLENTPSRFLHDTKHSVSRDWTPRQEIPPQQTANFKPLSPTDMRQIPVYNLAAGSIQMVQPAGAHLLRHVTTKAVVTRVHSGLVAQDHRGPCGTVPLWDCGTSGRLVWLEGDAVPQTPRVTARAESVWELPEAGPAPIASAAKMSSHLRPHAQKAHISRGRKDPSSSLPTTAAQRRSQSQPVTSYRGFKGESSSLHTAEVPISLRLDREDCQAW